MPDSRQTEAPLQLRVRFARPADLRFFYEKQIRIDRSLRVETQRHIPEGTRVLVLVSLLGAVGTLPLTGRVAFSAAIPGLSPAVTIELDDGDGGVAAVASFIDYVETLYESTAAQPSERRVTARLPVTAPVWLRFDADAAFANFYTKDVSRTGIFVFSSSQLPDGSPVEVLLALPGDERGFVIPGKIARHVASDPQKKGGMAIHFAEVDQDPTTREQLDRYLRGLLGPSGAKAPPARLFAEPPKLAAVAAAPAATPAVAPGVGTREPDPDEAIARLAKIEARARVLLRPASLDRLRDLFANELRRGFVFVYADRAPVVGRPVDLTLIIPDTNESMALEGRVERFEPDEQRSVGGRVGIRLLPLSPAQDALLLRACGPLGPRAAPSETTGGVPLPTAQEIVPTS